MSLVHSRNGAAFHAALACVVVALLLSGCDPAPDSKTVGQKVDAALDKTREVASDVRTEARTALTDAQARVDQDGPKVQERAQDAAKTAGKLIDDAAISAQISARLARDAELSALKIDVDTHDGAVILRGPAPSDSARDRAAELARAVSGVVRVDNQLVLKAG